MLFRIITWMFVIGIIYRILNRFILPAFRVSSNVNDRLRQMQDQMREMEQKANQANNQQKKKVNRDSDYIDYEEIK